jgi:hypothetical protein
MLKCIYQNVEEILFSPTVHPPSSSPSLKPKAHLLFSYISTWFIWKPIILSSPFKLNLSRVYNFSPLTLNHFESKAKHNIVFSPSLYIWKPDPVIDLTQELDQSSLLNTHSITPLLPPSISPLWLYLTIHSF